MRPHHYHIESMTKVQDISNRMFELYHGVHRLVNETMCQEGVSLARSKFLFFLQRLGPCRSTDIACALNYAPRTVTEAIDGLERDRLVTREPDPEDRRAKIVAITELGRSVLEAASAPKQLVINEIFSTLSDEEMDRFHDLVGKLCSKVQTMQAEREGADMKDAAE
ncbi:DNA-binding transcriptional regulator, MarR family [Rhizobium sp. RU20A]|nr:DNA-binding transcriptional regulator, MarR family [Rhizobium sp. RU20A]